jgi:hypothetical protein
VIKQDHTCVTLPSETLKRWIETGQELVLNPNNLKTQQHKVKVFLGFSQQSDKTQSKWRQQKVVCVKMDI